MCITSAVMDQYNPYIPHPYQWPVATSPNTTPYTPVPSVDKQAAELDRLIKSFRKAIEAAEVFDEITGQPDCIDPEKAQLLERVAQLEAKIKRIEYPHLITFHVEYDVDIDANDFAQDWELDAQTSEAQREMVIKFVQDNAESIDVYPVDNYVATVVE